MKILILSNHVVNMQMRFMNYETHLNKKWFVLVDKITLIISMILSNSKNSHSYILCGFDNAFIGFGRILNNIFYVGND